MRPIILFLFAGLQLDLTTAKADPDDPENPDHPCKHGNPDELVWVEVNNRTNHTSIHHKVRGGWETTGERLYICRNPDGKANYPGKYTPSFGICTSVGLNFDTIYAANYQILTNPKSVCLDWKNWSGHENEFPSKAIIGGRDHHSEEYAIARIKLDSSIQPGKAHRNYMYFFTGPRNPPPPGQWKVIGGRHFKFTYDFYQILVTAIF